MATQSWRNCDAPEIHYKINPAAFYIYAIILGYYRMPKAISCASAIVFTLQLVWNAISQGDHYILILRKGYVFP